MRRSLLCLILIAMLIFTSCSTKRSADTSESMKEVSSEEESSEESAEEESSEEESLEVVAESSEEESSVEESSEEESSVEESSEEIVIEEESETPGDQVQLDSPVDTFLVEVPRPALALDEVPAYEEKASVTINDGVPYLEGDEIADSQIWLSPLDELGRVGAVMMLAGPETLPTAKRGSISEVHPTGWDQNFYKDLIKDSDGALYRRCHMLMYAFSGLNATEENLVTGTALLNSSGMNGYEDRVLNYIKDTGHHVLYRCTPYFQNDELLCRGVLVEALSLEDTTISICAFCYNVQPGIELDYMTGANHRIVEIPDEETTEEAEESSEEITRSASAEQDYVANLNKNSRKFHYPWCSSVEDMKSENKWEIHCTREYLIELGFTPCKRCNP